MSRSSCIAHTPNQQLVIIRQDYLALCNGDHCAAALLNIFEYWTNVKLGGVQQATIANEIAVSEGQEPTQDTELWIYKRIPDFHAELMGLFGEKKIGTGLQTLKDLGFIYTRTNPKHKWDKTTQYLLNIETLNCAIGSGKNAASKKSKRAIKGSQNAAAIPETTTETTTKESVDPPHIQLINAWAEAMGYAGVEIGATFDSSANVKKAKEMLGWSQPVTPEEIRRAVILKRQTRKEYAFVFLAEDIPTLRAQKRLAAPRNTIEPDNRPFIPILFQAMIERGEMTEAEAIARLNP